MRFDIREEPIELYSILKIANLVASGGEAKAVITEGQVQVNGEEGTRKCRKAPAGDGLGFGRGVTV